MKKAIIVMFVVTVILTIAALIDEFMIQDTKHGQSRFTSHHPMKINTYKRGSVHITSLNVLKMMEIR